MKVWELMAELSKWPSGNDVLVMAAGVDYAHKIDFAKQEEYHAELHTSPIN